MQRYALTALAVVCALGVAASAEDRPVSDEARPRTVSWEQVTRQRFEPKWILPEQRVDMSEAPRDRAPDLVAEMQRFVALEFPVAEGAAAEPVTRSVGNLLHALGGLATDAERRAMLERLRRARPDIHRRVGAVLAELVLHDRLHGDDWDPDDDEPDDGLYMAPPVRRDVGESAHFKQLSGDDKLYQAAAFVQADTYAIKEAENNYAAYPQHVGSDYEAIYAVRDSYVRGKDPDARDFSALSIFFRSDLPFPYGTFSCDLRILNRVDADGHLRTHIYSPSEDFHWLAGQDVYLPVQTTEGPRVGTVLVRLYGFDIDDVPDGSGARKAALRGSLGNLKRNAEKVFATRGRSQAMRTDVLPEFPLRGFEAR